MNINAIGKTTPVRAVICAALQTARWGGHQRQQALRGFTLIEALVTIALLAIVAALAVPSLQSFVVEARISASSSELFSDLAFARSEAIMRRSTVSVCATSNGSSCATGSSSWASGRLIFVDADADGALNVGNELLRLSEAAGTGIVVTATNISRSGGSVSFGPGGAVVAPGTITSCSSGRLGRALNISATGRVDINKTSTACT